MAERPSVLFSYGSPFIAKAKNEPLTAADFGTVADHLKTRTVVDGFFKRRNVPRVEGQSTDGIDTVRNAFLGLSLDGERIAKPTSLRREIIMTIRKPLAISVGLSFIRSIFVFAQIYIIWATIKLVNHDPELSDAIPETGRYFFVLLLPFCSYMQSLCQHNVFHISYSSALLSRSLLCGLLFEKLKTMSPHALGASMKAKKPTQQGGQPSQGGGGKPSQENQISSGFLVNLVSSDANMVVETTVMGAMAIASSWEIIGGLVWVCITVGWAGAVLAGALVVSFPLQYLSAHKVGAFRALVQRAADSRLRSLSEFISGIQVVKLNAWEGSVKAMISEIRRHEEVYHIFGTFWKLFSLTFIFVVPGIFSVAVFGPMISYNADMKPTDTFLVIAILGIITRTYQMIPRATTVIAQAIVATTRIQEFLLMDTLTGLPLKRDYASATRDGEVPDRDNLRIAGSFGWNGFSLTNIDLTCAPKSLTVVLGTVGCGKSTLLQAILGECAAKVLEPTTPAPGIAKPLSDSVESAVWLPTPCGKPCRIAYVPQEAWIIDATVRENILFGLPFDEVRYREVVIACNLVSDFQQWGGDMAEVGEKGVTLSGGQRQRLSLARACYSNSDVYLLDDPISAVDANVGRLLLQNCITGFLKDKIVVLVTHHPAPARLADQVVFLDIGVQKYIAAKGTIPATPKVLPAADAGEGVPNASFATTISDDAFEILKELEAEAAKTEGGSVAPLDEDNADEKPTPDAMQSALDTLLGKGRDLHTEEVSAIGGIAFRVYKDYVKGGGVGMFCCTVFLVLLAQGFRSTTDWWFSAWTSRRFADKLTPTEHLYVLVGLVVGTIITALIRTAFFGTFVIKAASALHNNMFNAVIASPAHFFDSVPQGRIMNRFSKDVDSCDDQMPRISFDFVQLVLIVLGSLALLIYAIPWFAIAVAVAAIVFAYLFISYVPSARYVKRIEGASRSPVMQVYQSCISGISTLRAYHRLDAYQERFYQANDRTSSAIMHGDCFQRWVGVRMDIIAALWVAVIALLVIGIADSLGPSVAGLALSQSIQLTGLLQFSVRMAAETESLMTAAERLQEYAHLPPESNPGTIGRGVPVDTEFIATMPSEEEGASTKEGDAEMGSREPVEPTTPSVPTRVPASWPHGCDVVVKGLTANHFSSPERDVLQNLNFRIKPGQRVAVVGRTGAGKSSMLSAMFRLLNIPTRSVKIGGIDISALDVFYLRSRLGIIPQVPTLFHGTLRYNLDPFNKYTDEEMLVALRKVSMENIHLDLSSKKQRNITTDASSSPLDMNVGEGGGNLSVGQKQLLCAARALLANPAILFMDEATANIDNETDEKIQAIMREQAAETGMMVITIAHRLNTIMDYDLVLVLSAGRLVEFGNPMELANATPMSETSAALPEGCHCTTGDPENDAYFQTDVRDLSEVGLFAQMVRNMDHSS